MNKSQTAGYVIDEDTRKLTFTVPDFCVVLALTAAKQNKISTSTINEYAERSKHDYLPLAEYLLEYQKEHTSKASVSPIITP